MKIIFLALLIISFQFNPQSASAACISTKTSGSVNFGSQISGNSVVVCASTSTAKSATTTKTTTTKKVAAPVKVVSPPPPPPCIIKVTTSAAMNDPRIPGCTYQLVAPAKSVAATPKSVASTTTAVTAASDQAAFTPNPISITSSSSIGLVGQAFFFGAVAASHSRTGIVLGQPAQVSFTPISFEWSADDGTSGAGGSFSASWGSEGIHSVMLIVGYSASYSLGSGWVDAGVISNSASATVQVSTAPEVVLAKPLPPLLVSGNCTKRPGSYRC